MTMKFTPEVLAALAVLRNATENDFERHRLDILERDLTSPPVVEIIDDTHQRFNGETYLLDKTGHHRRLNYLHRIIWNYCYGEIPHGSEIHHVDNNSLNNDVSNLQILTATEHKKLHRKHIAEITCPICGKTFPNNSRGTAVYCSQACAGKAKQKSEFEKVCPTCGKNFTTKRANAKYCSFDCYTEAVSKLPSRICPVCGETFQPKTSHQTYCSTECKDKSLSKLISEKKCAICGKIFTPPRKNPNKQCCSLSCSCKLNAQTRSSK